MTHNNELATKIVDWLSEQKYGEENLLHAVVCCDWASRNNLIRSIEKLLDENITSYPTVNLKPVHCNCNVGADSPCLQHGTEAQWDNFDAECEAGIHA